MKEKMYMEDTLYLIDGSNLVYRAFFAHRDLSTRDGFPTNALFIYTRMLNSIINRFKPFYIAIIFDSTVPTFRNEIFPDYKGHRPDMPEGLRLQFPYLKEITEGFGLSYLVFDRYEADDIIGTLIERFVEEISRVVVISGDKDLLQLVSPRVVVLDAMKDRAFDTEGVKEKFGVPPERMVDLLALMGDSSDNIPGVKGIGEKRSRDLISRFGNLENLYERIEEVEQKSVKENLVSWRESAFLSRRLATIKRDVPINITLPELKKSELKGEVLIPLLKRFEFHSIEMELFGEGDAEGGVSLEKEYRTILTDKEFFRVLRELEGIRDFAFDIESSSKDPISARMVGISLCFDRERAFYIPFGHTYEGAPEQIPKERVLSGLSPFLEDRSKGKIGQNIKYDYILLKKEGIEVKGITFDTMIASYLLNPGRKNHNLVELARSELGHKMMTYGEVMEGMEKGAHFGDVDIERATSYSAEDAHVTFLLKNNFEKRLEEEGTSELFTGVELPLAIVLAEMEYRGVKVNPDILKGMSATFQREIDLSIERIYGHAGVEFNVNSPKQLAWILFDRLNLPTVKKTKTGYSTDQEVLETLAIHHPICEELLGYRSLAKLKSTYIDALPKLINPVTGRIHTSYNQTITKTGRLSSSEPNLQNIPVKTVEGRRIREAFIAPPGYHLLSADYSQIELRLLAHISGEEKMIETFREGGDIHAFTASNLFDVPLEDVTPEMRRKAKTVNFGIVYGMSFFGLARELKISRTEAKRYIEQYFERYPGVKRYWERILAEARDKKQVRTLFGRKRDIPNIVSASSNLRGEAEREAINTPIQGSAADIIKMAMIRLHDRIKEEGAGCAIIMQVHDELILEVESERLEDVAGMVKEAMENIVELSIPLTVSLSWGRNWAECY